MHTQYMHLFKFPSLIAYKAQIIKKNMQQDRQ